MQINVTNSQYPFPYLPCKPYLGSPYTWILKYDGTVYVNPDDGLTGELINGADIVLYYMYGSNRPGPVIDIKYS
jgi:hypothetical protein